MEGFFPQRKPEWEGAEFILLFLFLIALGWIHSKAKNPRSKLAVVVFSFLVVTVGTAIHLFTQTTRPIDQVLLASVFVGGLFGVFPFCVEDRRKLRRPF